MSDGSNPDIKFAWSALRFGGEFPAADTASSFLRTESGLTQVSTPFVVSLAVVRRLTGRCVYTSSAMAAPSTSLRRRGRLAGYLSHAEDLAANRSQKGRNSPSSCSGEVLAAEGEAK